MPNLGETLESGYYQLNSQGKNTAIQKFRKELVKFYPIS